MCSKSLLICLNWKSVHRRDSKFDEKMIILSALKNCSSLKDLNMGKQIHINLLGNEQALDRFVENTLIDMYVKCGSLLDAREVFEQMLIHTVVSWNCIIMGYAQNGDGELAVQLYARMQNEGYAPDRVTFLAVLKACSSLAEKEKGMQLDGKFIKVASLEKGKAVHSQAIKSGHETNNFVASSLIDMYAKCGRIVDARLVFDKLPQHNLVLWNCIILGYADDGESELALQLFARMQEESCVPDGRTYVAALKACSCLGALSLQKGKAIHAHLKRSDHQLGVLVENTLVVMYAKCASMADAYAVFDGISHPTVVSWNCIIMGYVEIGEAELALQMYARMNECGFAADRVTFLVILKAIGVWAGKEEGNMRCGCLAKGKAMHTQILQSGTELDVSLANALLDMYGKCRSMADAYGVFVSMSHHTVVSWTAIMLGYAESGESTLVLQLYSGMLDEGCVPDARTYVALLKACSDLAAQELGKKLHAEICIAGFESDVILAISLVDFYGKCGSMVDAQVVFDAIPNRDTVAWNALLTGYSRQGNFECVFNLLEEMQKECLVNDVTFLSVLNVCNHAGLVDKGREYFQSMNATYGVAPKMEHYTCMVDLLGRNNQVDEAVSMVKRMPFEANVVMWTTVLSACCKWTSVTSGRLAFESVLMLEETNATAFALMSNIYARAGMWEDSAKLHILRNNIKPTYARQLLSS